MNAKTAIIVAGMLGCLASMTTASGATAYFENFEAGHHVGWFDTSTGGNGATGVEQHNGSNMAYVSHSGAAQTALSRDFTYSDDPNTYLEFDMEALATTAFGAIGGTIHSTAGVIVTLLNRFSVVLGSARLVNATNPASLGANAYLISSGQHSFAAPMQEWAELAGLSTSAPIAKISLTFFATAAGFNGGGIYPSYSSFSKVWVDNVKIGAVPLPGGAVLMLSAALGLVQRARARKAVGKPTPG